MATTITFRLTDEEKRDLEMIANEMGMTVSQVIRIAIKNYIDTKEEKTADGISVGTF